MADDLQKLIEKTQQALNVFNNQQLDECSDLCIGILNSVPVSLLKCMSDAFHMLGLICLKRGRRLQGEDFLQKAVTFYPENFQAMANLGLYYAENGEFDKAEKKLKLAQQKDARDQLVVRLENVFTRLKKERFPGIFINTIPKSGSLSIWTGLYGGLDIPRARLGTKLRSLKYDVVHPEKAEKLAKGNLVAQEHLIAAPHNLDALEKAGIDKVVVHVRDPRQAMLSWVHHIDTLSSENGLHILEYPLCDNYFSLSREDQISCPSYFDKDFSRKVDVHLENYFPILIDWLMSWVELADNPNKRIKVLFTFFEDLKFKPDDFYLNILKFYEIDPAKFSMPNAPKKGISHFRKGQVDEFRQVFTPEQLEKATRMMPDILFEKFGWER